MITVNISPEADGETAKADKFSASPLQERQSDDRLEQGKEERGKTVHWVMVIDLRKCFGCKSCAAACSEGNLVPANTLRKVIDCGAIGGHDLRRIFLPISCMHCRKPSCLEVCPTGATYQRSDGIVNIDETKCLGCGYCQVACPYRARSIFNHGLQLEIAAMEGGAGLSVQPRQRGVSIKCNFCLPRIESGLARQLRPGLDEEATPNCVITCSGKALHFGDINDPDSEVSQLLRENNTIRLQEDCATEPSIYYILVADTSSAANAG